MMQALYDAEATDRQSSNIAFVTVHPKAQAVVSNHCMSTSYCLGGFKKALRGVFCRST